MTRLPTIPPQYRKRPARKASAPQVQVSEAQYWQLMAIRSNLSRIAASLTWAGVADAVEALEVEIENLRTMTAQEAPGLAIETQQVLP